MGSAVTIMSRQHEVSGIHELEHQCHRGHSSAGDYSAFSTLELGERVRQIFARRITGAGVVVKPFLAEPIEGKGRRKMDWRHDGAVMQIRCDASPHGAGGRFSRRPRRGCSSLILHDSTLLCAQRSSLMNGATRGQSPRKASCPSDESSSMS